MAMYRTHLLLNPEQHRALAKLAEQEGRSISDIAREFIQEGIEQRQKLRAAQREQDLQALQKTRQVRQAIMEAHGGSTRNLKIAETIGEMREDRDDQTIRRRD